MPGSQEEVMIRSPLSTLAAALLAASVVTPSITSAQSAARRGSSGPYYPSRWEWEQRQPEEAGMTKAQLDQAIQFAISSENPATKDLSVDLATTTGLREPFDTPIGPTKERGSLNGLVVRHGYIVAEWGDTQRVDMTFSATKTFLSTVVGLAWQKGLIKDVHDRVRSYVPLTDLFDSPHNEKITWDHLLRQTSDWRGTLWGKPDWADRPEGDKPGDYPNRPLNEPGTRYKYNDVRVNLLALAALHVWRRPLPQVLREEIMEPIEASNTWRWQGYENSWVVIDGQQMQSVSGGGHWGGGMFISARDMARFGYLFLRNGKWKDRQIVSEKWIQMARKPGSANPGYGYMNWFLNTDKKALPSAPESSVTFRGAGSNIIYIDWENDLVAVVRWIQGEALDRFVGQVLGAIKPAATSP